MSLVYQAYAFAEPKVLDVHGEPAFGAHLLRVRLEIRMKASDKTGPLELHCTGGRLDASVGTTSQYLGRLFPMRGSGHMRSYPYSTEPQFEMTTELSRVQLAALEDLRVGQGVTLGIWIDGVVHGGAGTFTLTEQVTHPIPLSVWLDILKQCKYQDAMVIEVPIPGPDASPHLQNAAKHLREAEEAMGRGRWRECVGACRDVLEALSLETGDPDNLDGSWQTLFEKQKELTKESRMRIVRRALRILTHPARHVDEVTVNIEWLPEDAKLALAMAAAAVRRYSAGKA